MVASSLPRDFTTWADLGFVQYTVIPGLAPVDSGDGRLAMVQIDAWAVQVSNGTVSEKRPLGRAWRLGESERGTGPKRRRRGWGGRWRRRQRYRHHPGPLAAGADPLGGRWEGCEKSWNDNENQTLSMTSELMPTGLGKLEAMLYLN
jgi:hypothetical protein